MVLTTVIVSTFWGVYGYYTHLDDASSREEYYQRHMACGSTASLEDYKHAREQSSALRDSMQEYYDEWSWSVRPTL